MTSRADAGSASYSTSHLPAILITGAATGIGRVVADYLIERSHRIVAVDIDEAALNEAFRAHSDEKVLRVIADIARSDQATKCISAGVAQFGALDAVVNNAALHGGKWLKPCLEYEADDWVRLFAVNVFAIPMLAKAAQHELAKSQGVVVNMSSMVGYGHGASCPYAVSKAAVNGMTIALSEELGRHGVRVVGLAPGFISTPTVLAAMDQKARDRVNALQALSCTGEPEDVAAIIAFLISPQARIITGTTVVADLGVTRRP